ncbi:SDR family oxidoreductase [Actinoplanes sp. NPDC049265]|uniref:SDR family oxidoreductase n=1 Tax=Actinoplanes sp. NPDC049265 TaxID=3363902 RepID=UPI00371EE307
MRIFVTGASGWIGTDTVKELLRGGHSVLGLARSDASAERITALGADVHRGGLDDLDSLRTGTESADGVVHLGYNHDFTQMEAAVALDRAAIETMGAAVKPGGPFVIASGVAGLVPGRPAVETDMGDPAGYSRAANATIALGLADRGVRSAAVRFAPTVHGRGDHGFVAELVRIARATGVSGYVGDGAGRWAAVHRDDAAVLVRLAVEQAEPGSILHAVAEPGVPTRDMAAAIGRGLGVPVESRPAEHFGWLGRFFGADLAASSEITRKRYDWTPAQAGLIADLDEGHYFTNR